MASKMQQVAETAVRRIDKELDEYYHRMVMYHAGVEDDEDDDEDFMIVRGIC